MIRLSTLALCAGALLLTVPTHAAEFEVKMLNKGPDNQMMTFDPPFLKIQSGDTVKFVAADKGHDAESIPGMLPDGATPFKGKLSQDISVTFDKPGLYGYRCVPHFGMGMVGLIEVGGSTSNLDAAKQTKMPPLATKRMTALLDQAVKSTTAQAGSGSVAR
ncbi:MAG: pseudoazurin [Proteobacteria bacterium]|nr:pseudoazurin [Pseudomonadota bacterium]